VPHLAQREVLVRFPNGIDYRDRDGQERTVDWIAVDLDWLARYEAAFASDRALLRRSLRRLDQMTGETTEEGHRFGVRGFASGVVLLAKGENDQPEARQQLDQLIERLRR